MAEDTGLDVLCEDGVCVIDTAALKEKMSRRDQSQAVLILLTRGTYGSWDDGFSAIQVGNAALASESPATLLLLDDGVYFGVKGQDPSGLGLPSNIAYIEDFLDIDGRILALERSLTVRGLTADDLVEGIQVIPDALLAREIVAHRSTLTF